MNLMCLLTIIKVAPRQALATKACCKKTYGRRSVMSSVSAEIGFGKEAGIKKCTEVFLRRSAGCIVLNIEN